MQNRQVAASIIRTSARCQLLQLPLRFAERKNELARNARSQAIHLLLLGLKIFRHRLQLTLGRVQLILGGAELALSLSVPTSVLARDRSGATPAWREGDRARL